VRVQHSFLGSLSLVGTSGGTIIGTTLFVLFLSIGLNLYIRARYASLERDIDEHKRADIPFDNRVLNRILEDARDARLRHGREANVQAIIEHQIQSELGGLLLGERFVRASVGLVIILGLLGTFTGLTLSVGQLVSMIAEDPARGIDVMDVVTVGLTRALSGMSVAFSASLFGIGSAIVLTFFGIISNVTDKRTAVMVAIEAHLERALAPLEGHASGAAASSESEHLAHVVNDFGNAVAGLESAIMQFNAALQSFAGTTRDFKEFNLHLKDNVQRMSLSFADVSETVRHHINALGREPHGMRETRR
jgi:MotA/TolQ/ExbB proton channel family